MLFKSFFRKLSPELLPSKDEDWDVEDQARYIAYLMQWYAVKRSAYLANLIVVNLESYKARSDGQDNEATAMKCERLIKQWRYLANNPQDASLMGV